MGPHFGHTGLDKHDQGVWDQRDIMELSGHIMHTMYSMHKTIYQPNWIISDVLRLSMEAGEYAGAGCVHMTRAHRLMCMHAMFLHAQANISV